MADLLGQHDARGEGGAMQALWIDKKSKIYDDAGDFSPEKANTVMPHGLGQIARPSESSGPGRSARRRASRAARGVRERGAEVRLSTRLGIPVMFHEEALHGLAAPKGTHFPIPIALGATWDPALVERVMSVAAKEARARGCQQVLSPVLDLGARPALGPHRGDLRRGPVPRHAARPRRHPRLPGPGPAARGRQGLRDRQALRGARAARGRHQHRARSSASAPARGAAGARSRPRSSRRSRTR